METLKHIRQLRGKTQTQAAADLGVTSASLSRIERGLSRPRRGLEKKIAAYYDLTLDEVQAIINSQSVQTEPETEQSAPKPKPPSAAGKLTCMETALMESYRSGLLAARQFGQQDIAQIPVIGETAAGYGYSADMDLSSGNAISMPRDMLRDPHGSYFALIVRGASMEPELVDGDIAIIHQQSAVDNGDIGLVVYGDDESAVGTYGTLKRVRMAPDSITLTPINPAYDTVTISGEDLRSVRIQGKLAHVMRTY